MHLNIESLIKKLISCNSSLFLFYDFEKPSNQIIRLIRKISESGNIIYFSFPFYAFMPDHFIYAFIFAAFSATN